MWGGNMVADGRWIILYYAQRFLQAMRNSIILIYVKQLAGIFITFGE